MDNERELEALKVAATIVKVSTIKQCCGLFALAAVVAIIKAGVTK